MCQARERYARCVPLFHLAQLSPSPSTTFRYARSARTLSSISIARNSFSRCLVPRIVLTSDILLNSLTKNSVFNSLTDFLSLIYSPPPSAEVSGETRSLPAPVQSTAFLVASALPMFTMRTCTNLTNSSFSIVSGAVPTYPARFASPASSSSSPSRSAIAAFALA